MEQLELTFYSDIYQKSLPTFHSAKKNCGFALTFSKLLPNFKCPFVRYARPARRVKRSYIF